MSRVSGRLPARSRQARGPGGRAGATAAVCSEAPLAPSPSLRLPAEVFLLAEEAQQRRDIGMLAPEMPVHPIVPSFDTVVRAAQSVQGPAKLAPFPRQEPTNGNHTNHINPRRPGGLCFPCRAGGGGRFHARF